MSNPDGDKWIFVCSDSIGETGDAVARATMRQFHSTQVKIKRYGNIHNEEDLAKVIDEASSKQAFIAYTLVQPELREMLKRESIQKGVRTVDIMGPMMQAYVDTFDGEPLAKPGLLHRMDDDYFKRVEAMEFTVKYDDGRDPKGILTADIVLIGVSRTSKTPLSVFLAHKGFKVANLPLIPEVKPAPELKAIATGKLFGLTMDAEKILNVRVERLKALGLSKDANYASLPRILEELEHADKLMKSLGCTIIDVSNKAIEETAGLIVDYLNR